MSYNDEKQKREEWIEKLASGKENPIFKFLSWFNRALFIVLFIVATVSYNPLYEPEKNIIYVNLIGFVAIYPAFRMAASAFYRESYVNWFKFYVLYILSWSFFVMLFGFLIHFATSVFVKAFLMPI